MEDIDRSTVSDLSLEGEEWRPVARFGGLYEVSSLGRLLSHWRIPPKLCGIFPDEWGYLGTRATMPDGSKVRLSVHREVCVAWHGPPPFEGAVARHIDGNNTNNIPGNLRWGSVKQNVADSIAHGTFARGSLNGRSLLTEGVVRRLRAAEDWKRLADELGIKRETARSAVKRRTWRWLND